MMLLLLQKPYLQGYVCRWRQGHEPSYYEQSYGETMFHQPAKIQLRYNMRTSFIELPRMHDLNHSADSAMQLSLFKRGD